ncbi:hypothetical protein SAMN05216202_2409 [Pseudomonas mucidolens]|uniref:Response regulatory domain-containing protein n=1 Tax=Pseudomonas mucidolens TaxID=46679 RepID=A0A1H2MUJ4_9PSED|nr:hypothetical protein SAMN05216202_2409 [Pseudomonas mucidolens]SQH33199.1 araC family DNA-binding response regulator [Pseudomonas mucidolens]
MQVNAVSPGPTPHVLIIDDSVSEVRPLLQLLRTQPWRISFASDPHQGYQRALTLRPERLLSENPEPWPVWTEMSSSPGSSFVIGMVLNQFPRESVRSISPRR